MTTEASKQPNSVPAGFWREAGEPELLEALEQSGEALTPEEARALLLNPFLSSRVLELLLEQRSLRSSYRFKLDLVRCRLLPLTTAMALVPGLYWRDLVRVSTEVTIKPQLRRQAEQVLLLRLARLSLGERIAMARMAGRGLIVELRTDAHPRVVSALLENPRLTVGDLLPLLVSGGGTPAVLSVIAKNRKWGRRYSIRLALARNKKTPPPVALELLSSLKKHDLRALSRDPATSSAVQQRCRVLLGEV